MEQDVYVFQNQKFLEKLERVQSDVYELQWSFAFCFDERVRAC